MYIFDEKSFEEMHGFGKIILKNCNVDDMMIKEKLIKVKKSHEK